MKIHLPSFSSYCRASVLGAAHQPVGRRARPAMGLIISGAVLLAGLCPAKAENVDLNTPPLMKDFIGINGDFNFRPDLYHPICGLYRMYQPGAWDLDKDTSTLKLPFTKNGINWDEFYTKIKDKGYRIDASVQIDQIKPAEWKDIKKDGFAYGEALAKYFGPSGHKILESVEIGNEPADWNDKEYHEIFESMAKGLRAGDPKLKIVTAAAAAETPDAYSKSVKTFENLENYYDVLNVHTYAFTEMWPTWKRTFPEDPAAKDYLKVITDMIRFRDQKAKGKEIWVTEFGYDASTQPSGDGKFVCVTDTQQAQWLARSLLVFSSMGIQRAYVYFYNDGNQNSFHAAAGLTRNWEPKPSYYALAHLYKTLGDYRFSKVVTQNKDLDVFEYVDPSKPNDLLWVAWSPTGADKSGTQTISVPGKVTKAELMPLKDGAPETVEVKMTGSSAEVPITESPIYLWISK